MEYQLLLENLRSRLNVLNTSIFLLENNIDLLDEKTHKYISQINKELERIRKLINEVPQQLLDD
ncbi:MAG TPA: hypothetical protein ENJ89_03745 [Caldithrix abyssi]|uniref:Uncharacterized protein n=1 Tax=Caldithrix abyssi TaxID=187145 RepID=A0A7V5UEK8_CALAY|nr:hypothetical protein [Caldithrix abyssi]